MKKQQHQKQLKKDKFVFNAGVGNIFFFKRHSNFFLVFLDSKKQHIVTITSGLCKVGRTKKQKISALNLVTIIKKFKTYYNLYNIQSCILSVKQNLPFLLSKLWDLFDANNIIISGNYFILCDPHGTIRGRTPRRV